MQSRTTQFPDCDAHTSPLEAGMLIVPHDILVIVVLQICEMSARVLTEEGGNGAKSSRGPASAEVITGL